ncbi:hypothetical protein [Actinophytocola sp.]|uniref:COG1470 family protein n=1 Tax=Actinophytocola sp. TaxID=1872138 RepID=UPI002ED3657C
MARFGLLLAAAVLGLVTTTTGAAADPTETPETVETTETPTEAPAEGPSTKSTVYDLAMTATFDKPSYDTGEKMVITVTVTNNGTGAVNTRASFFRQMPDLIRIDAEGPFVNGERFVLEAGETVTHTLTGQMPNPDITTGTLYGWLTDETGATQPYLFTVPIERTVTHAAGVVYYDKNRNKQFDEGEGQRDVMLTWTLIWHNSYNRPVTTDANGVFRLDDLPTGAYGVGGTGLGGLQVGYTAVDVGKSGVDDLALRGTAPVYGLTPKLEFTKDSYAADESPVVRVTLTNTSDVKLTGIVATCNRAAMPTSLNGTGDGWGALRDGVDIPPHSTVTFEVTEPMPPFSPALGLVTVGCEFRYPEVESSHNPYSFDRAAVPGVQGRLSGTVTNDYSGPGVGGVRLVMVPDLEYMPATCAIVAETTTAADGTFTFQQVPVGIYLIYIFPPPGFRAEHGNPWGTDVYGDGDNRMGIVVVPGEARAPELPACVSGTGGPTQATTTTPRTPVTTTRPAPQGGRVPALANTGASILTPGVTGLLALLAGTGLVVTSRRRRTN